MIDINTIRESIKGKTRHILPFGGIEPCHVASKNCWCQPLMQEDNICIHHAMDCREAYERQHGKPRNKEEYWLSVLSESQVTS